MDETTLKLALAGLVHDIGIITDRQSLGVDQNSIDSNGHYLSSHGDKAGPWHSVATAAFIEKMKDRLPEQLNAPVWGDGDCFINLAAGHNTPETIMQHIIAQADRLTSGLDWGEYRETTAPGVASMGFLKTYLVPLFEQLEKAAPAEAGSFEWHYPIAPINPDIIFPKSGNAAGSLPPEKAYEQLFQAFCDDLSLLKHAAENIELWFEHFTALLMVYTSMVPAAQAGKDVPDVSLYDHMRLTAAFAAALYLYHRDSGTMTESALADEGAPKFVLVTGSFYGIQNFIFSSPGETRKQRSKILRGRSFYVTLLSELAADMLCMRIGLPATSVILNAAGKFTILAPDTPAARKAINQVHHEIRNWLMQHTYGEVTIGFGQVSASQSDFKLENFKSLWQRMVSALDAAKFVKVDLAVHGGAISDYLDLVGKLGPCRFCGKRPRQIEPVGSAALERMCCLCHDHLFLGANLVRAGKTRASIYLIQGAHGRPAGKGLTAPIFGRYQFIFNEPEEAAVDFHLIRKVWDLTLAPGHEQHVEVTRKLLNSYVPLCTADDLADANEEEAQQVGDPLTFGGIAAHALPADSVGLKALGVLKADVDNLGLLMGHGLSDRLTISRLAALSRQLDMFFTLYLPHLLRRDYPFIYTVFAGGDDLFLIGPWNSIYTFVLDLQQQFARYVCQNPAVHFSAGISIHKPNVPLDHLAATADQAMEASKEEGRERLTMFDVTAKWLDLPDLEAARRQLEAWLKESTINSAMLYRLDDFIHLSARAAKIEKEGEATLADMHCLKWRALLKYSCVRNVARDMKEEDERARIVSLVSAQLAQWLQTHCERLIIALWHVLYLYRQKKEA